MHFVTSLTSLFESIAMIISQHQPVVEKYYGAGKMYSVIRRLIGECDRVVISIVGAWEDERSAKRKVRTPIHTLDACFGVFQLRSNHNTAIDTNIGNLASRLNIIPDLVSISQSKCKNERNSHRNRCRWAGPTRN